MSYVHSGSVLFQNQRVLCAEHAQTKSAPKPLQNTLHGKGALQYTYIILVSSCALSLVDAIKYVHTIAFYTVDIVEKQNGSRRLMPCSHCYLTRFNKIAIQGTHQMAVDKEAISLSKVYSYSNSKCTLPL